MINTAVCIKQVPQEIKIDKRTGTLAREGIHGIMNSCDKNALELAITLKEKQGGVITLITMGPPQVETTLVEGLAMGADQAILLCHRDFAGADTLATSYALAMAIKKVRKFHLILCGKETADSGTAHVGPQLAQHLGLPQITNVIQVEMTGDRIRAKRVMGDEYEVIEVKPPVLLTVMRGINEPRLPTFSDIMEASSKPFFQWCADDITVDKSRIGLPGSPTKIVNVSSPEAKRKCEILTGSPEDIAAKLAKKLNDRGVISTS